MVLDPSNVVRVYDFSNETLQQIVEHLDVSTRFDHFVYRESELDGVCRLVEMATVEGGTVAGEASGGRTTASGAGRSLGPDPAPGRV